MARVASSPRHRKFQSLWRRSPGPGQTAREAGLEAPETLGEPLAEASAPAPGPATGRMLRETPVDTPPEAPGVVPLGPQATAQAEPAVIDSSATPGAEAKGRALPWIVAILLFSLIVPFVIQLGTVRLSVYRIFLILTFVPVVIAWLSGAAGRIRLADILMVLLCTWGSLSFFMIHGAEGIQAGGILFFETLGAYLVARVYVRSAQAFRGVVRVLFFIVLVLLPFAILEALTGRNILLDTASSIYTSYSRVIKDPRLGLERVQSTFEHPILFGVFCGSAIALTFLVLGHAWGVMRRAAATFMVLFTAGLSLSAGPMTGMMAQMLLLGWNWMLRNMPSRWKLLAILVAAAWIFLEVAATRSPAQIFIAYFSFDHRSAYTRLHIWNFGTASILNHPLFGIGFNEWERPPWMTASIDMYWIVPGVRHGIPAMALCFAAYFAVLLPLIFRKGLDAFQHACRLGIVCCLLAFFMVGWTVHFWNATYVLFYFLLGAGVWLLDAQAETQVKAPKKTRTRRSRYARGEEADLPTTRFGNKRSRA